MCELQYKRVGFRVDFVILNKLLTQLNDTSTYWISYVLPGRYYYTECEQDYWGNAPMKAEYWWIDVDMRDLDQGL